MAIDPTIYRRSYEAAAGPALDPMAMRRQQVVEEAAAADRDYRAAQLQGEQAKLEAANRKDARMREIGTLVDAGKIDEAKHIAYENGDLETAKGINDEQDAVRKRAGEIAQASLPLFASLKNVPAAIRKQAAMANADQFEAVGIPRSKLETIDFSDAGLGGVITSGMTAAQYLEQGRSDRIYEFEREKFGNTVNQQNIDNQFQGANLGVARANLGLRQQEVALGAVGGMTPKEGRRMTIDLRSKFDALPEVKEFKAIAPVITSARRAPDNAAGDIQLAYTVGKILDPNSVVREGELAMAVKAGSPLERLLGSGTYTLGNGGRMTPQIRKELLGMLNERALANRQAYDAARNNYVGYASEVGINPQSVVGTHVANAYQQPKPKAKPTPKAASGWGKMSVND